MYAEGPGLEVFLICSLTAVCLLHYYLFVCAGEVAGGGWEVELHLPTWPSRVCGKHH